MFLGNAFVMNDSMGLPMLPLLCACDRAHIGCWMPDQRPIRSYVVARMCILHRCQASTLHSVVAAVPTVACTNVFACAIWSSRLWVVCAH